MRLLATAGGVSLILIVLWETFETVVLPRRVSRRFRLTRLFYRVTWKPYAAIVRRRRPGNPRENFLSINALGEFLLMRLPPLAAPGGRPGQLGNDGMMEAA
jgi:hypothetical protein